MAVTQGKLSGLDQLLDVLDMRYEYDDRGRLIRRRIDGVLPRFVLARAVEGCAWRFRADLDSARVTAIARLAGREPGLPIAGERPTLAPERLVMIERLLALEHVEVAARREVLGRNGIDFGEIWTID